MRNRLYTHRLVAFFALVALLSLSACREKPIEETDEDYKTLFPFTGISKPETSFEDMVRMPCDPAQALSTYKYPGVEINDDRIEYIVTLRCQISQPAGESQPNYSIRYINAEKKIVQVRSNPRDDDADEVIKVGEEFVRTFKVRSGYPLYLSVNGIAPRGSAIKASISARSVDGLVVVPTLVTDQSQNKEGPNPIPQPYCEYIILP